VKTKSREETIRFGEQLAATLNAGDIVALTGELGSGKTTLVKGIAKGLGVKNHRYVNSPSFVIIKEYQGRVPLYHFDVFRLQTAPCSRHLNVGCLSPMDALSFEEYFYKDGICVVEWADRIRKLLPKKHIEVKIKMVKENIREIKIRSNKGK
jgi:tRNA threonylcarbamoyladenosine biosynthesis protein TsaE